MSQPEKITVVTAWIEFPMCPSIFIGLTADGCTVYARYRWGLLSVRIDPRDPAPNSGAGGIWILEKQLDEEGLDGWMEYDELREHTAEIIVWPDELSPRPPDDSEPLTL